MKKIIIFHLSSFYKKTNLFFAPTIAVRLQRWFSELKIMIPMNSHTKIVCYLWLALTMEAAAKLRTWTSIDGKKTFQGELVSFDGKTVKINRSGRELSFDKSFLSKADVQWIENQSTAPSKETTTPTTSANYKWSKEVNYEISLKANGGLTPSSAGRSFFPKNMPLYEYNFNFIPPIPADSDAGYTKPEIVSYRLIHEGNKSSYIEPKGNVKSNQFKAIAKWHPNDGVTLTFDHDANFYQGKKLIAFDKSIEALETKPELEATFRVKIKNKIFDKTLWTKKMSIYKTADLSAFEKEYFTDPNFQPPPDLVDEFCRKANSENSTVIEVLQAISKGLKETFTPVGRSLYSGELSYAYEKREMNCNTLDPLFRAFCSAKGIPTRPCVGFVIEFQSGSTVEYAGYRNWTECFVPEIGWVPVDIQGYIFNPRMKKSYIGTFSAKDSLRFPVEDPTKSGFSLRGVHARAKSETERVYSVRGLQAAVTETKVKRLNN